MHSDGKGGVEFDTDAERRAADAVGAMLEEIVTVFQVMFQCTFKPTLLLVQNEGEPGVGDHKERGLVMLAAQHPCNVAVDMRLWLARHEAQHLMGQHGGKNRKHH